VKPWHCPDCSLVIQFEPGVTYTHDPGCPTASNDDAMMDDDRAWFDAHPKLDERRRPVTRYEAVELNWANGFPVNMQWGGEVVVHRGPVDGVRFRNLSECYAIVEIAG
jgi:hypothetical protein